MIDSAISATREMVEDGRTGRLIDPNADALVEAVWYYLSEPSAVQAHGE